MWPGTKGFCMFLNVLSVHNLHLIFIQTLFSLSEETDTHTLSLSRLITDQSGIREEDFILLMSELKFRSGSRIHRQFMGRLWQEVQLRESDSRGRISEVKAWPVLSRFWGPTRKLRWGAENWEYRRAVDGKGRRKWQKGHQLTKGRIILWATIDRCGWSDLANCIHGADHLPVSVSPVLARGSFASWAELSFGMLRTARLWGATEAEHVEDQKIRW